MNDLPRWSLDAIYPSVGSKEFSDDLGRVRVLASALEEEPSLALFDELTALMVNLDAYVSALISTDTENEGYLKALSAVEDAEVIYKKAEDRFTRFVGQSEAKADDPLLLRELRTEAKHLMSEREEALAAELARSGENAWSRLQETLSSSIRDGEKTLTELRSLAFSPDRAVRKDAFEIASAFGSAFVLDERLFPAFIGLSGSGIAYVFQFIHALAMGAVEEGIPYQRAVEIAADTMDSAITLVKESGRNPVELASMVCSAGGTTIRGMNTLASGGFDSAVIGAVKSATERSITLEKEALERKDND